MRVCVLIFISALLLTAQESIACGKRNSAAIKARAVRVLHPIPEITLEYLDLVDPDTIRPVDYVEGPVRTALAAWIGKTRLIDNILCEPPAPSATERLKSIRN